MIPETVGYTVSNEGFLPFASLGVIRAIIEFLIIVLGEGQKHRQSQIKRLKRYKAVIHLRATITSVPGADAKRSIALADNVNTD